MKLPLLMLSVLVLSGCQLVPARPVQDLVSEPPVPDANGCIGTTDAPAALADKLALTTDPTLQQQALGEAGKGGLCKAAVYEVTHAFTLYRAWNSTYGGSRLGNWWAFSQPSGLIAGYREDYEICYQWSPIDKLVRCSVKPGTRLVIGPGQSASCSQYFSYDVSAAQQVYIDNASAAMLDCNDFDAVFRWQ